MPSSMWRNEESSSPTAFWNKTVITFNVRRGGILDRIDRFVRTDEIAWMAPVTFLAIVIAVWIGSTVVGK